MEPKPGEVSQVDARQWDRGLLDLFAIRTISPCFQKNLADKPREKPLWFDNIEQNIVSNHGKAFQKGQSAYVDVWLITIGACFQLDIKLIH